MTRRLCLIAGLGMSARAAVHGPGYRIVTRRCSIGLNLEFHDRVNEGGLLFQEGGEGFCLSRHGAKNKDCMKGFLGALAIARYEVQSKNVSAMREFVRTIDRDHRLDDRLPFNRKLALKGGVASDIQAFGYEGAGLPPEVAPWYYFRQDLFLDADTDPFLTAHWKHALNAIRLLDLIPGEGTTVHEKPR